MRYRDLLGAVVGIGDTVIFGQPGRGAELSKGVIRAVEDRERRGYGGRGKEPHFIIEQPGYRSKRIITCANSEYQLVKV